MHGGGVCPHHLCTTTGSDDAWSTPGYLSTNPGSTDAWGPIEVLLFITTPGGVYQSNHRGTVVTSVPTMLHLMMKSERSLLLVVLPLLVMSSEVCIHIEGDQY